MQDARWVTQLGVARTSLRVSASEATQIGVSDNKTTTVWSPIGVKINTLCAHNVFRVVFVFVFRVRERR